VNDAHNMSQALTILSSMITPVVLILATGSLLLTTSQRLGRVIERTRVLNDQLLRLSSNKEEAILEQAAILFDQLLLASQRARLLQQAMTFMNITLSIFVATSISIGLVDLSHGSWVWAQIVLGVTGAALLFFTSMILIRESRIAIKAVRHEMYFAVDSIKRHFPELVKPHQ
jgi:hypothetical protein